MAGVKVNFSVDSTQAKTGINDVKNELNGLKNQGSSAAGGLDKIGDSVDDAVRALDGVAGAAGMASTGIGGLAGDLIKLATNPIAIAIAAFGALVVAATFAYDAMTQSSEQWMAQIQNQLKSHEAKSNRTRKAMQQQKKYLERLKQLGKEQFLTNSQRIEAGKIIDTLCTKYNNLTVSIDKTTGKLKNLVSTEKEFIKQQAQQQINAIDKQLTYIDEQIVAAMVADVPGQIYTIVADYLAGAGFFVKDLSTDDVRKTGLGTYFKPLNKLSKPSNISFKQIDEANELLQLWNSGQNDKRIQFLTGILKNPTIAKDKDVNDAVSKVIELYNKRADKAQEKKLLQKQTEQLLSSIDQNVEKERLKKQQEKLKQQQDELLQLQKQKEKVIAETERILDKSFEEAEQRKYDAFTNTDDKIKFLQEKATTSGGLAKFYQKSIEKKKRSDQLIQLYKSRSQLNLELTKEMDPETRLAVQIKLAKVKKEIAEAQLQISEFQKHKTEAEQERIKYENKILQLKEQQKRLDEEAAKKLQEQQQKLKEEQQKKLEEEQRKLQEQQKRLEEEQRKIKQKNQEQFKNSIIDDSKKVKDNFFNMFGNVKNLTTAAEKIVQAEKKLGRSLTEEEKGQLYKIEQIENAIANVGNLGLDNVLKIQTNSLTARGGWAGGVNNMTTLIDINKRIANYSQKQMAVLKDINDKFSDVGRI